ncbi:hypothetical protein J3E07_001608 [Methanococcus voltae]|uniref:Uncharacterized protein n=1 Tax=Methanococcus voltae TaxID=2188 RepID=A0A8J7UT25_METVO|nr:hypothetical protein [Methanococcus voltae]MBP2202167.1 hypothetical protein [Methanococcus voltae]
MKTSSSIGLILALLLIIVGAWYLTHNNDNVSIPIDIFNSYNVDATYANGSAYFLINASKKNTTIDNLDLYVSYDNGEIFNKIKNIENITLPYTINISTDNQTKLSYYIILKNNLESIRIPKGVDEYNTLILSENIINDTNDTNQDIIFTTTSDFNNISNTTLITLNSNNDLINTIQAKLFTSINNESYINVENKTTDILPITFEVITDGASTLNYYIDVLYNNTTSKVTA